MKNTIVSYNHGGLSTTAIERTQALSVNVLLQWMGTTLSNIFFGTRSIECYRELFKILIPCGVTSYYTWLLFD